MQWQNHGPYVVTLPYWTLICEWCMPRVVVQNGHERQDMLRWDWTICSLCNLITEGSTVSGIGRAHVITYRERQSSLWPSALSFKSCISTPIPILEVTIFVIHNYLLDETNVATSAHNTAIYQLTQTTWSSLFCSGPSGVENYLLTWLMSEATPPIVDWIIKCIFRSIQSMYEKKKYI